MKSVITSRIWMALLALTQCAFPAFAQWTQSGSDIYYTAGKVGIGTSSPAYLLHVETSLSSRAIFGKQSTSSGAAYGGWFESASTSGMGVFGLASASTGYTYGVYGRSLSTSGKGIMGHAAATSGVTYGMYGLSDSTSGMGVYGWATASSGNTIGTVGRSASTSGIGVKGFVTATSGTNYGGWFESASTSGTGVYGLASATSGDTIGVYGRSESTSGKGVAGLAAATSGSTYGVYGQSNSTSGTGVAGWAAATSGITTGVYGRSDSTSGTGVFGFATATSGTTYGVYGRSDSTSGYGGYFVGRGYFSGNVGIGTTSPDYMLDVAGRARMRGETGTNTAGIWYSNGIDNRAFIGLQDDNHVGFWGQAGAGWQLQMRTDTGNVSVGPLTVETAKLNVATDSSSTNATLRLHEAANDFARLEFTNTNTARKWHIAGLIGSTVDADRLNFWNSQTGDIMSISGDGKVGIGTISPEHPLHVQTGTGNRAIYGLHTATSGVVSGVYGRSDSTDGIGVYGEASATSGETYGVYGVSNSATGRGVYGLAAAWDGTAIGVIGRSDSSNGYGVFGWGNNAFTSSSPYGVFGQTAGQGYAVYARGRLAASGTKSFQIDHPLSPENAYLNHFCTEGPEPYNAYSGNVVTDAQGYAVVQLPDYFESINRDFRYQLTVIDSSDDFVLAKVVREIQNNRFVIRTSKPYVKVSWRVEAVRNDRWVQEYGYQTEQPKPAEHRGKYLHPELYGQPKEMGIHYRPELEREVAPAEPVRR